MNPRPLEPFDPVTMQPVRIPWGRWLLIAGGVVLVLVAATWFWLRSYVTITVASDTTVLTTPLLADGYPDYVGYLDAQNAAGVKPEENAWIAILRCCGPDDVDRDVRAEHFRKLGIEPLPDQGAYFRPFYDTTRLKSDPEPVIIAASVAAQLPWHVRFARLAALNADDVALKIVQNPLAPLPHEDPRSPWEIIEQTLPAAAISAWDAANTEMDPSLSAFEGVGPATTSEYVGDGEANFQDLRPEALAKIKPAFADAAEEREWRRGVFETARERLLEREELIVENRSWSRDECPLAAYWVDCYSPHLDQLQTELQQRQKFYYPYIQKPGSHSVIGAILPPIGLLRNLAVCYRIRAELRLGEKNHTGALRDATSIIQLAALMPQHPFFLEGIVSVSLEGFAYSILREIILDPETTDEQLVAIDQLLMQSARQFDLVDCLDHGERLSSIGQVVATVARGDDTKLFYFFDVKDHIDHHWERKLVDWDAVLREINLRYDRYRDAAKTRNFSIVQQTEKFYETFPANRKELEAYFKNPPWYLLPSTKTEVMKMIFPDNFLPILIHGYAAILKGNVRSDLARIMVALERFRRANNTYPAALAELVPTYLPAVPNDPFDGKPLKYFRTPTGGYRAYSVWQNGIDDGGLPNVDEADSGTDYKNNDLVIGSPDEIPRRLNLAW